MAAASNNSLPGMFNALSHIIFTQNLIHEIFDIVEVEREIIRYTCANHQLYAMNCGLSYLPVDIIDGQPQSLAFMVPDDALRGNEEVLGSIARKILSEMNIQRTAAVEQFTFDDERVIRSIQNNNMVTNIFIRGAPRGTNP